MGLFSEKLKRYNVNLGEFGGFQMGLTTNHTNGHEL